LLGILLKERPDFVASHCRLLRRLPVNVPGATRRILAAVDRLHPECLVMCGMGGSGCLKIERVAELGGKRQLSHMDLKPLVTGLSAVRISAFAGRYVCNETYYRVLKAIRTRRLQLGCLFVHVPMLDKDNVAQISRDFYKILLRLSRSDPQPARR
jgi:pyroglutamyl-peptidase